MKSTKTPLAIVLLATAAVFAAPPEAHASVAVSISVFHDDLAPYGRWVGVGSYGSCFVPRVAAGWAPYVDGQWVYTDYGWTWVSNDPFGDVPFHYGSWTWADPYGWIWVPGTVWAPAWVTWAYGDDYVGWAPVPPSFGLTVSGYVGAPVVLPATRYVFVPTRQFVGVPVASVRIPAQRNTAIFSRTVKTTDYRVSGGVVRTAGPPAARIERVAGTRVAPVSIDRVKARPTTITDAGAGRTGKIRVVAPASETRKLATSAPEPRTAAEKSAPAAPGKEAHGRTAPKEPAATTAHGRETTAPSAGREAGSPPAHAATRESPKNGASHAAPNHEKPPASTQKHEKRPPEKAPAHEPAPNPSTARAHPAEPPRTEPARAPQEESRLAAHGQPHPASPANHSPHPAPKGKPADKKPPEKPPEQKPQ